MLINTQIPTTGGSERITIADNAGHAEDQICRLAIVIADVDNSGTVRLNVGSECTATTGIPIPLHSESSVNHIPIPIDNTNKLYFYGSSDDDIVDILWLF